MGFNTGLQERFQIQSSQAWDSIILFQFNDEREVLELFFQLFEQFRQEQSP